MRENRVPVNAPDVDSAIAAVRAEMHKAGYAVVGVPTWTEEPIRPFGRVAIAVKGATTCYVLTVQYRKVPA